MTQENDIKLLDEPSCKNVNWHSVRFKENLQYTPVLGVQLKVATRYMGGRHRQTPTFIVTPKPCKEAASDFIPEQICIPIPNMGWRKAWKQALLALSAHAGRRHVVRQLNRPPKLEDFLESPEGKQQLA